MGDRRNIPALVEVRDWLATHEHKHNQAVWSSVPITEQEWKPRNGNNIWWRIKSGPLLDAVNNRDFLSCNTVGCVAGWASFLAGDKVASVILDHTDDGVRYFTVLDVKTPDGRTLSVSNRGAEVLGIGYKLANNLFAASNKLPDLIAALDMLIAGTSASVVGRFLNAQRGFRGQ